MVRKCCVKNCPSKYKPGLKDITFHRCPAEQLKQWKTALLGLDFELKPSDLVCSKHFRPDCFHKEGIEKKVLLKKGSVPTIFHVKQKTGGEDEVETASAHASFVDVNKEHNYGKEMNLKPVVEVPVEAASTAECATVADIQSVQIESSESTEARPGRRRVFRPRYIGHCSEQDFRCPRTARRNWELAVNIIAQQRKKIKHLQRLNRRQADQIHTLESWIVHRKLLT